MLYIDTIKRIKLGNIKFNSITSDGKYFYLTLPKTNEIYVLDKYYRLIDKINTDHPISCLTFVSEEMIFLGTVYDNNKEIFVYDMDLMYAGRIPIPKELCRGQRIMSIGYNDKFNKIFIGYETYTSVLDYSNNFKVIINREGKNEINTGIDSKDNMIFSTYINNQKQCLEIIEDGKRIYSFIFNYKDMIKDIFIKYDKYIYYLFLLRIDYNGTLYVEILTVSHNTNYSNRKNSRLIRSRSIKRLPCSTSIHDSCDDIIESIARIESKLTYIIGAEAEKIQKVLCECSEIDDILRINESVNETIVNITHMEIVLYEKLKKIINAEKESCINHKNKRDSSCRSKDY